MLFIVIIYNLVQNVLCYNHSYRFIEWFQKFKIKVNSNDHFIHIFNNWLKNDQIIKNHDNKYYILGHNEYSGMNSSEFSEYNKFKNNRDLYKSLQSNQYYTNNYSYRSLSNISNSIDWRKHNVLSPIQNQGNCGSCWSFSGIATLESTIAIKTGKLVKLSEQQGIDCAKGSKYQNLGCQGGMYYNLWNYARDHNGLCTEESYPYKGVDGVCEENKCNYYRGSRDNSFTQVRPNDDIELIKALNKQPVSIAIEADQYQFQLYKSGIFTNKCGNNLDHAVVLVGYGTDDNTNTNYYILRNSWGRSWGEDGYMRILKDGSLNDGSGQCGLLSIPMYPNL